MPEDISAPEVSTDTNEKEMLLEMARSDFLFYIKACDPKYIVSHIHLFLAKKLQDVAEGKCNRLIISCPPRAGKSRLVCIEFPSYLMGKDPTKNVVIGSYAQSLANIHSRETRRRVQENDVYHAIFPNTRVNEGDARLDDWGTKEGGRYKSVGVGSGITGRGADVLILDDLVKDFQEANSQIVQDGIFDWLQSTALTRLAPGAPVILIMTRWAQDDPVGRILAPEFQQRLKDAGIQDADKWEVVNLPALCDEPNDPLGRKMGESIFPERFSEKWYIQKRAEVGSFVWAALYCGRPTARGGNYIKVDKIRTIQRDQLPKNIRMFRYWDLAATEKKTSDYTVGVLGGIDPLSGVFYIVDVVRGQWEWPTARERIVQSAVKDRVQIGIEAVAGFKVAFQNLQEILPKDISCTEFGADKDKMTRALPWIAMVENEKVAMVAADWNIDLMMELEAWPRGKHDDQADGISGAYLMAKNNVCYIMPVNYTGPRPTNSDRHNRTLIG